MSINLAKRTDEDWRTGLVVPPAGHVHGKTALSQQEWRELAHRRPGVFVLVDTGGPVCDATSPMWSFAVALGDFRHQLGRAEFDYRPDTGRRLKVVQVT